VPSYDVAGFNYDPTTFTATWTLSQPIGLDKILLNVPAGAVLDATSRPLSAFSQRFDVVPGDMDRNGRVDAFDTLGIKAKQGSSATTAPANYSSWYDYDGNGRIDAFDTLGVKARQGSSLTQVPGEPTSAVFSAARVLDPALAAGDELASLLA
jgi:hypothetical protein